MPMHLHASHEPKASIGAHMSHAASLGMKYIWHTEHDVRMGQKENAIPHFSFTEPRLECTLENGVKAGFSVLSGDGSICSFSEIGDGYMLSARIEGEKSLTLGFRSEGKVHCDPLFARLAVELDMDLSVSGGSFSVAFVLSAQPPSYEQARLVYAVGGYSDTGAPTLLRPFPEKDENGKYRFEISRDAGAEIGGLDNALCGIEIRLASDKTGITELSLRSVDFHRELNFEDVRQEQIKLASSLGEKWGMTPFVSYEITGAGHHMCVYSTRVPVINYAERGFKVTPQDAIAHARSHGAIYSYNHPFSEWNYLGLSHEEKLGVIDELAENLIESRVRGASLIEVGFPVNKGDFDEKYHLPLWDKLSLAGVFISGDGDSDNHFATEMGWTEGNNFCSYIGIKDSELPCEEAFIRAMKRGSLWFGDPAAMGDIDFGDDDVPQGSVIVGDSRSLAISVSGVKRDGKLIRIVDGNADAEIPIQDGCASDSYTLVRRGAFSFVRYEIRDSSSRLIASTNPMYLAGSLSDISEDELEDGRLICG